MKSRFSSLIAVLGGLAVLGPMLQADVALSNIFGDHMVLQRLQTNPLWGTADPGEKIVVKIHGQYHTTTADEAGDWRVMLNPVPTGGPYEMIIEANNTITLRDILIGEVWLCSGQSNMVRAVDSVYNADVEILSANYPNIRLISVPNVAAEEPQDNFDGQWEACSPTTVASFSAVGYVFGRRLHNTLGVPIGLIDNAWGASNAEAWVPRETLEADEAYHPLLAHWDQVAADYSDEKHEAALQKFHDWQKAGKPGRNQRAPRDPRSSQKRPANLYNGVLHPVLGYGIRGTIWYQGEGNAGRAYQYRDLFPLMITTWREQWGLGDFPFYWVQLADYRAEQPEPGDSDWAELREAQTMTLSLPHTGQAVIIDTGEARDIHPRDKQTVAHRLVRHALAKDYGYDIAAESPRYATMEQGDGAITLTLDHVSKDGLFAFDVPEVRGFAIAGEDQKFVWAEAEITGRNQIKVSSPDVPHPVAVRYAWADNPVANLRDLNGLPVTPFRTDDWPGVTAGKVK
ncbi:MAG: sialate O-acetylesterase [Synoicihabitans sp.]